METTRLWLEESNIRDDLIALAQQNSSKICRKKCWRTLASEFGLCRVLTTVVKPWITRVANNRPCVWRQDSAPCHTSGKNQKWLSANFYDYTSPNIWPPNSPDLNPMDYYVWDAVEKDTNRRASTTKAELINIIKAVFETLPRESVKSACSRFRGRIEAVIDANGGYFE